MAPSTHRGEPESPLEPNVRNLFWTCFAWTVIHMGLYWHAYLTGYSHVPEYLNEGYLGLLGIYTALKERERWAHDGHAANRTGAFFVLLWLGSLMAMGLVQYVSPKDYALPEGMPDTIKIATGVYIFSIVIKGVHTVLLKSRNGNGNGSKKPPA